jgi:cytochrome c peroxidase
MTAKTSTYFMPLFVFRAIKFRASLLFLAAPFFIACRGDKENQATPSATKIRPALPAYLEAFYSEPTSNPLTAEGVRLGRDLFFEKALSLDYTISCASCHRPEFAFADKAPLSRGIMGQMGKRNTPSLLNAGLMRRLFWDGRDSSLESQSLHPIQDPTEMGLSLDQAVNRLKEIPSYPEKFRRAFGDNTINPERMGKALAQFERSLVSGNSRYDRFLQGKYNPDSIEMLGMQLFFTHPDPFAAPSGLRGGNCGDCHLPQTLLGDPNGFDGFHNTGLARQGGTENGLQNFTSKASDFGRFKTPGLRNVALTAPYMHDGRFQNLDQVLDHYNSDTLFNKPNLDVLMLKGSNEKFGTSLALTEAEKKAIIRFLHMLTDSTALRQ